MTAEPAADFEDRRFQTAAAHYLAGRPPYPGALIDRVVQLIGLTRDDRVLDLGCGPGQLARAFAGHVAEAVAMDPEPQMLAIAHEQAAGVANMRVVQGRSDDLDARHGRFKAVVIGRAFHWMDREEILAILDGLIEPGGAVVLMGEETLKIPENRRIGEFNQMDRAWSADDRSHPIHKSREQPHVSVLLASPFSRLEQINVILRQPLTLQTLTDRLLSFSSTSRARLGDKADDLLAELARKFADWEAEGPMEEVLATTALVAWRN
ncbi:MAG TPA: methyltransferase domain-containing protein [Caulobacteraceae bacterium]